MANGTFGGGSGTELDPFLVEDADDLNAVRNDVFSHYKQVVDIDMSVYSNWVPIGDTSVGPPMIGSYDGGGNAIANLNVNNPNLTYAGLFAETSGATLKNINVSGVVLAKRIAGLLVGSAAGGTTIVNCGGIGEVSIGESEAIVGGLVGQSGNITDCYYRGSVSGGTEVGGFIGVGSGSIENCYTATPPLDSSSTFKGGLIGTLLSGTSVTSSYYDSETSGQSDTGKGEPKTTAEMKDINTYLPEWNIAEESLATQDEYGWNRNYIWRIGNANDGYPFLRIQPSTPYNIHTKINGAWLPIVQVWAKIQGEWKVIDMEDWIDPPSP